MSTKARNAVMFVTMPGSCIPGRRSSIVCTLGSNAKTCNCSPRVEALLVERFEDVRHGRQPHVAVHVSFGPYGFAQGLVREQLLHGDARIGGHAPGDVV